MPAARKPYAIVTLTCGAFHTGVKLRSLLEGSVLYTLPERNDGTAENIEQKIGPFTASIFANYEIIIFIMAAGIAVRAIAPLIKSKTEDPGIVVMDEKGEFAISLLSGHLGGANDAARLIAEKTGARAVITTATDVNRLTAVDTFARDKGLVISDMDDCREVTSVLVNGGVVGVISDFAADLPSCYEENAQSPDAVIHITSRKYIDAAEKHVKLIPKNTVLGMGSRKGADADYALNFVLAELDRLNIDTRAVRAVATIDLKKDEPAVALTARHLNAELKIFTPHQIRKTEHLFEPSEFVKAAVGVSSVSGPAAYLAAEGKGKMIAEKIKGNGITLSVWQEESIP